VSGAQIGEAAAEADNGAPEAAGGPAGRWGFALELLPAAAGVPWRDGERTLGGGDLVEAGLRLQASFFGLSDDRGHQQLFVLLVGLIAGDDGVDLVLGWGDVAFAAAEVFDIFAVGRRGLFFPRL